MIHSLRGRDDECGRLDGLLGSARAGTSGVLVLRGEAGIGKTALLEYVAGRCSGARIARAAGVQSEMELPFAGAHHLFSPLLDGLDGLPQPQREALQVAFGLERGEPNRFLIALAMLGLLAEAAEAQPLVCLIDDAQWLDRASAQALAFVARRLLAEPIAMIFAVRDSADADTLAGLPELTVGPLADGDARSLLRSAVPSGLDERLRDRIIAETRGNPLALLELPRRLTPEQLAGGFVLPDARPLASRIEQRFLERVQALARETQLLLLIAAAEPVGDGALLWRAAERLGIGVDAGLPAEAAGLIELGPRVEFLHPLVRSAVYRGASGADRREVHAALADVTDPHSDPDRRAWHRAYATVGTDEAVAGEMIRSAGRAQRRGGVSAAAAFLQRAADLTPDPELRAERALTAAQMKLAAGDLGGATELLRVAGTAPGDADRDARASRMQAEISFTRRRGRDAPPLLLDAARRLATLDPLASRETYLEAMVSAMFAGRLATGPGTRAIAEAARSAPQAPDPPRPVDLLLDALVTRFTEGYVAAAERLSAVVPLQEGRWLWLACRLAQDLWDDELWYELSTRGVRVARETGALSLLPLASVYRAALHVHQGEFAAVAPLVEQADALQQANGSATLKYASLLLAAWRGDVSEARPRLEAAREEALARGEGMGLGGYFWVLALMHNGNARHAEALDAARQAVEHDDVGMFSWSLVELVEAAVRQGETDQAAGALCCLTRRTQASATPWALGIEATARALVHGDEAAYREAIERLTGTRAAVHLARSRLLYGEWLRREDRRLDAREQLRAAHQEFARIGCVGFTERARRELHAAGEAARNFDVDAAAALTPQEAQVARLARDGHTNPEIGSQLFISPRTVEYHLRKVFRKLDVSTRRELEHALSDSR